MDERSGNSVSGSNRDIAGANSTISLRLSSVVKLEKLGDTARDFRKHDEAIGCYSNALSLHPTNLNDILLKRSNEVWIVFHVTSNGPR